MADEETTTILAHDAQAAIRLMLSKMSEHDVTRAFQLVGGAGPVGDLAAEAMKERNIDL